MSIISRLFGSNSQETRAITKDNCPFGEIIYGHGGGRQKALSIPSIYAAVSNVADTLSTLELNVYKWDDKTGATPDYEHPVYRLFNVRPNPVQTPKAFRFQLALDLQTEGECICEIVRDPIDDTPVELWRIDPTRVQTKWDRNYRTMIYLVDGQEVKTDRLMHAVHFSLCGFRGVSPFDLCKDSLELTEYMNSFGKSFFKNAARPSGFLTSPPNLRQEVKEDARKQWNDSFSGVENVGKTPNLPDGFDWKKVSVDPEEGQFSESRIHQLRECQRITRTPPTISNDYERQTWSNIQYARMDYVQNTIRPLSVTLDQGVGRAFITDTSAYVEHKLDDLLRGSFSEQIESLTKAVSGKIYTSNEARQVMGLPAHQDGDKLDGTTNGKGPNGNPGVQNQPE